MSQPLPEGLKTAINKALQTGRTKDEILAAIDPRFRASTMTYMGMGQAPPMSPPMAQTGPPPPQYRSPVPAPVPMQSQQQPPPTAASSSSADPGAQLTHNLEVSLAVKQGADKEKGGKNKLTHQSRRDYEICMVFPYKAPEQESSSSDGGGCCSWLTSCCKKKKEAKDDEAKAEEKAKQDEAKKKHGERQMKEEMMQHEREAVMKNLQACGLHLYCYYSRDRDEIFCKIGASAQKLRDTAARIKYKLQLKPEYLSGYAEYRSDFPGRAEFNFKDRRQVEHIYRTFGSDDFPSEDAIFSTRDKITLVHYIICTKEKDCAGISVGQMLNRSELKCYFPLHEQPILRELESSHWSWLWMQPAFAHQVRDYFGEKVSFYFLFMSFYWQAWIVPAVVGVAVQACDLLWRTPDNITAVPFCIFISVWSVLLTHFWRRQESKFAIEWGTYDLVPERETYRPQFVGEQRINPMTHQVEPFYDWKKRIPYYLLSFTCITLTSVLCIGCIVAALWARHLTADVLPENLKSNRIILFQFALAILVEVVNRSFAAVAEFLTNLENHRTESDYERHLMMKVMLFKFVSSYFVLYYVAFLKKPLNLFGMACWRGDCMLDMQGQLFCFVVVRLTISNAMEYFAPKVLICCRGLAEKRKAIFHNMSSYQKLDIADMSSAEMESKKEEYASFSEFDEVLISHGYASLFAVSSPWVCTATLIWAVVECYLDVKGLCESRKRPLPLKVRNIEPWDTAFEVYGYLAALTNVSLLVFASHQYEGNSMVERIFLWLALLHLILFFKVLTSWLLPEMPRSVEMRRLKQDQKAHMALSNIKMEPEQDFTMLRHQRTVKQTVNDQDHHDIDAEDQEPHFGCCESLKALWSGLKGGTMKIHLLLFLAAFVIAILTFIALQTPLLSTSTEAQIK